MEITDAGVLVVILVGGEGVIVASVALF